LPRGSRWLAIVGLAAAFGLFAFTFRGQRARFWERMTLTGFVLGAMALANEPQLRRMRWRKRDLMYGLGSAGVLYGIFQIGDRFARSVMPRGSKEIKDIYALRTLAPPAEIATRLATVIGPAEEYDARRCSRDRGDLLGFAARAGNEHAGAHHKPHRLGHLDLPPGSDGGSPGGSRRGTATR